jgi:hypothetical protein
MKKIATLLGAIALITIISLKLAMIDEAKHTHIVPAEALYEHYYPNVVYMLANDSIMDIHRFWGIDTITYYDWEESANALGVPAEIMTIDMYMAHLQMDSSKKYVRNRY